MTKVTLPVPSYIFSEVADLAPQNSFGNKPPQMVPRDPNIGFLGLAVIQGQISNPA